MQSLSLYLYQSISLSISISHLSLIQAISRCKPVHSPVGASSSRAETFHFPFPLQYKLLVQPLAAATGASARKKACALSQLSEGFLARCPSLQNALRGGGLGCWGQDRSGGPALRASAQPSFAEGLSPPGQGRGPHVRPACTRRPSLTQSRRLCRTLDRPRDSVSPFAHASQQREAPERNAEGACTSFPEMRALGRGPRGGR